MGQEVSACEYQQLLDEMLNRMRQDIAEITRTKPAGIEPDLLDEYLFDLNSYYYRSFKDYFFPRFLNLIDMEISRKFKLRRQEEHLQQDIISSMQRYVKLYNQVKTVANLLTESRQEINQKLIAAARYQDMDNADFLLALKQLQDNLRSFKAFTLDLTQLFEDGPLIKALNQVSEAFPLTRLILQHDFSSQKDLKAINSLLLHFTALGNFLQNPQKDFWDKSENVNNLLEKFEFSMDEFTRKSSGLISQFYNRSIKKPLLLYLQLLGPGSKSSAKAKFTLAQDFENWLDDLAVILERLIFYAVNKNNMLPYLTTVISLPIEYARWLNTWAADCVEEVTILYDAFIQAGQPDFAYFHRQTAILIEKYADKLNESGLKALAPQGSPLQYWQKSIDLELSSLSNQIDFLKEKNTHLRQTTQEYLEIINLLDTHLNLLASVRSDLERLLAPRNISRAWKDILIRIERIPLQKGQVFPADYKNLLQDNLVQRKTGAAIPDTILYEAGDLFIIKVNDQIIAELPHLVLAE